MNAQTPFNPEADFDPTVDPYYVSNDDIRWAAGDFQSETRVRVNQGLAADPDDAAEAVKLADITNEPAPWVMQNLDERKEQVRQATAQQLVLSNPALVSYLQSHPMAASVSNDDWANLDAASESSSKLAALHRVLNAPFEKIGEAELEGVVSGFQGSGFTEDYQKYLDPSQNPAGLIGSVVYKGALGSADLLLRTMGAIFGGVAGAAKGAGEQIGGPQLGREAGAVAEYEMMRGDHELHAGEGGEGKPVNPLLEPAKHEAHIQQQTALVEAMGKAAPWMEAGIEPPAGLHPLIDEAKAQMNDGALTLMDEALQNVQASTTRERSTELMKGFLDQFHKDATFEIHSDAALNLYGDKPPAPDDGLLGWVPDIDTQLAAARDIGQGVAVKISDWLTHVEPEVAKTLHDDIRMWPGGITAREAAEPPVEPKSVIGDPQPIDSIEKITSAAIKASDGQVFTGATHADAYEEAIKAGIDINNIDAVGLDGFLTSSGRYVDRREALGIAEAGRQFRPEKDQYGLRAEQLKQSRTMLDGPLPQVRDVAGLEPKFAMGDRKLTFEPKLSVEGEDDGGFEQVPWEGEPAFTPETDAQRYGSKRVLGKVRLEPDFISPSVFHNYNILDENKQNVGVIKLGLGDDKTLYVDWVGGNAGLWSNSFGPSLVRDIKRQLKGLYPDFDYITGFRVSGARSAAGAVGVAKVKLSVPDLVESLNDHEAMQEILQNGWQRFNEQVETNPQPVSFYTPEQLAQGKAAQDEIERIAPGADVIGTAGIRKTGTARRAQGLYQAYPDRPPTILHDLLGPDQTGVLRHEAVHYLRDYNFFKPAEWSALESAARAENWAERYGINERYAHLDENDRLEESAAEAFREWARQPPESLASTRVGAIFQKLWDFLDRVRQRMGEALGRTPTWEEVFQRTHSGEVGRRGPGEPAREGAFDLREKYAIEGDDNLRAQAVGLPVDSFKKLQDGYRKRNAEDLEAAIARNKKIEERNQSKEWRANRADMAKEVAGEIRQRPDIAADAFVGSGELGGQKLQQRYTLRTEDFTPEQRAAMPEHYTSKNGLPADQVAGMFGYGSKDELVSALAGVHALRTTAEGDRMGRGDFLRQLVQTETDRRMEARYGDRDANVMDAAIDRALSQTNINVMHQDLMAATQQGGVTAFDKDVMQAAAKRLVDETSLGKVSSYRLWQESGRHSRVAEKALLSKDFAGAAVALQRQTLTAMVAKEIRAVEKEMKSADGMFRTNAKRERPSIPPANMNWVHTIMGQIGKKVDRMPGDLARQIASEKQKTLKDFVAAQTGQGKIMPVWEDLFDPAWSKSYKDLTVAEFRQVRDSIKTILHNGRDDLKLVREDQAVDFADARTELVGGLADFAVHRFGAEGEIKKPGAIRYALANLIQVETMLNRWDKKDWNGPWQRIFFRDLVDSANTFDARKREMAKGIRSIINRENLADTLPNPGIRDPINGELMILTRENLRTVIANMGNESNWRKFSKGWNIDPKVLEAWVHKHATKADFDFVQGVHDMLKKPADYSDAMHRIQGGVPMQRVEGRPFQTQFGVQKGGYYPVVWHDTYKGKSGALDGISPEGLFGEGYSTGMVPGAGYRIERVDYDAPMALTMDQLPNRIVQTLRDGAMRGSLINASKILRDPAIRNAILRSAGEEWEDTLKGYLRRLANTDSVGQSQTKAAVLAREISNQARRNLSSALIAFNYHTVAKHFPTALILSISEVGPRTFYDGFRSMLQTNTETGQSWRVFAIQNSLELQRRLRNSLEEIYGANYAAMGKGTLRDLQDKMQEAGSVPVGISDRVSADVLWVAAYRKIMKQDPSTYHVDAVSYADRAVRHAHGSTSEAVRPLVYDKISPWFTIYYNFFNRIFNNAVETYWDAKQALGHAVTPGERTRAVKMTPGIVAGVVGTMFVPALIEYEVSGQAKKTGETVAETVGENLAHALSSFIPVVREFSNYIAGGGSPDAGLISSEMQHLGEVWQDMVEQSRNAARGKPVFTPKQNQRTIRDLGRFMGAMYGTPDLAGNMLSGLYGLSNNLEHPRGPSTWGELLTSGHIKHGEH